ncbi:hypothetical protein BDB01DRAFT_719338 [Pilobolus umbonatus]|nr:hypothetical protein BDB01DRAFT_719338 [Pilobolus umbonatus]
MGFRLFKYSAAVIGLLTFGSMTWIALSNLQPVNGYINNAITMLLVPIGLGLIGSIVYFVVLTVALYASCAFGGFALAVFICSWASNLVIVHEAGRGSFLGGLALLLAIVTYFAADQMVLFATSFIGAYATILGVDCLARTGFIAGFQTILNNNPVKQIEYELNKYTYVLLAVTLVLFLIAMVIQMLLNKGRTLVLYEIKTQPVDDETGHSKYAPSTAKEATPAPAAEEKDAPPEEHPKSPAPTHAA